MSNQTPRIQVRNSALRHYRGQDEIRRPRRNAVYLTGNEANNLRRNLLNEFNEIAYEEMYEEETKEEN